MLEATIKAMYDDLDALAMTAQRVKGIGLNHVRWKDRIDMAMSMLKEASEHANNARGKLESMSAELQDRWQEGGEGGDAVSVRAHKRKLKARGREIAATREAPQDAGALDGGSTGAPSPAREGGAGLDQDDPLDLMGEHVEP